MKINLFNSAKYFFTGESVKRKITDLISENLADSYLESKEQKKKESWQLVKKQKSYSKSKNAQKNQHF